MSGAVHVRRPNGLGRRDVDRAQALTEILHVRVSAGTVERLNALADERRVEVSELVRQLLTLGLISIPRSVEEVAGG